MIKSFLDTDLYKFTMQQAVCQLYPNALVRYNFINRDNREFPENFGKELKEIVDLFRGLILTENEKKFLQEKCYYLNPVYLDFLSGYRFDPNEINIEQQGSKLTCVIEGYWYKTILWEVPLMAIISQLYFKRIGEAILSREERKKINCKKFSIFKELEVNVADFGTRRRYSFKNHDEVIQDFIQYGQNSFIGTSNVYFAMKYNLNPIGTYAHEFVQYHAAKYGYDTANESTMKAWLSVYQGALGIALPDTFTSDFFFRRFNIFYAKIFDGLRHDSSSPMEFIKKSIKKYNELRINPISKIIVFSDNINSIEKISKIHNYCLNKINDVYAVGTWLTNDVGLKPLNIVIKLVACLVNKDWVNAIKLSDDFQKNTGNIETIKLCKEILKI